MKNVVLPLFLIIFLCLLTAAGFVFFGAQKTPDTAQLEQLPWQISHHSDGTSEVFGLHLEHTTLAEAKAMIPREAQIRLFRDQDTSLSVEVLFERISLSGIISNLIVTLDVPDEEKKRMEQHAVKREPMPTGAYELHLQTDDEAALDEAVIAAITYTPYSIQLDQSMIEARFGQASETLDGSEGVKTLLYPDRGLAITLNSNKREKELFQYIAPRHFDHLRQTLYGAEAL